MQQAGQKTQLVLVPGLLCNGDLFLAQQAALADRADIHIANTLGQSSIQQMADRVLAELSGPFVIAGLSMGGYVALAVARAAPDRVMGLGLLSTNAIADSEEKKQQRRDLIALSKMGKFKGVTPRLLPRLLSRTAQQDEKLVGRVMAMAEQIGQANFTCQQQAIMDRPDMCPHLPAMQMPSLVLCGTQDVLTPPEQAEQMDRLLPASQLHLLDGIGHLSSMEAPDAVSAALGQLLDRAGA